MLRHNTILAHWVFDTQLTEQEAGELAVADFSLKYKKLLSEYVSPSFLKFSTGIYSLIEQRWGIDRWFINGYTKKASCCGKEDREKYHMFNTYTEINHDILHSILGGGEFPFIYVYEKLDDDGKYHYIYWINR